MSDVPVIKLRHVYKHPVSAVWKALTTPELHAKWWAAGDVRPVVGHKFDLDMGNFGKQACEVLKVEHEKLIQYRFSAGFLNTLITWELSPENGGTRLTLTHEGFNLDSPLGRQAFEGMKNGWPAVLTRMDQAL